MKIFLVYLVIDSPQNQGYNYGLGYIAAVLKQAGHEVGYFILKNESDCQNFYQKIQTENPKIIGFSATTSQFSHLKDIAKEVEKISSAFLVAGGVHTTLKPESILAAPELDAIVRGEGEYPMKELAEALAQNQDYFSLKNFWFRRGDEIIKNPVRPLIKNLDELPFPDKSSLDYQKVIDSNGGVNNFIFSRGCPFECTYCSNRALAETFPDKHHYFRQRSPRQAITEIERDEKNYKFKLLDFDDDTISLNKKWFYEFFTLYKEKFKYPFMCNLRVGTFDDPMAKLLKEAGAVKIGIGIEHGNEKFRREMLGRQMTNQQIIDAFRLCDKYNITHWDFVMVGLPGETKKLFLDTVRLCRQVSARGRASIFYPYPATKLGKICEDNGWLPDKEYFKERKEATIDYPNFSKKDIQLCADVFPFLVKFKFIPLFVPLSWVRWIYFSMKKIKKIAG